MDISLWIAFSAGLLSFLSPCVLPLVPVYLTIIGGETAAAGPAALRFPLLRHSLLFVLGFSAIFILLGAGAGLLGSALSLNLLLLRQVSGGLLIALGIYLLAALKVPWLSYQRRLGAPAGRKVGYLRSFVIGAVFAFGWTPCVGPILGGILAMALSSDTVGRAAWMLAVYSLGLGLPFMIMGLAFDYISPALGWLKRHGLIVTVVSGLLLIGVGVAMLTNTLGWISSIGV